MLLFSLESLPQAISGPGEHFFCVPAIPAQGIKACKAAQDGWKGHLLLSMCKQMLFFLGKCTTPFQPACCFISLSLFFFFSSQFSATLCAHVGQEIVLFFFPSSLLSKFPCSSADNIQRNLSCFKDFYPQKDDLAPSSGLVWVHRGAVS